ncbi:GDSL esterase/lipase [Platanthera guangdongensis]|uniref:GDSL esterase/lipase n=1 Tax=Platanthera guangdongensis TaxID=2320717 RepID=A0ABR2MPL2_9ASPA
MVPAMFVFGDSLIDNGNNNGLASLAKANYYPYGIDFAAGPTGRFSNGYTIVDGIADLLGLPLIPAHSEASGDGLLYGVNYASAAAGILDITGRNFIERIPFNQQITNFQSSLDQITANLGAAADVAGAIADCIFYVGMGSNDYLNNYLMPNYNTRNIYNSDQFSTLLVQQYTLQLTVTNSYIILTIPINHHELLMNFYKYEIVNSMQRLYNLGARKFVLMGVGSLGCIPSILAQNMLNQCAAEVDQDLVLPFNSKVKKMVNGFNSNLPAAKFTYIDSYKMIMDIINNHENYGFKVINSGCCGIGRNRGQITCLPFQTPCPNRDEYVFWDAFHPTEKVNVILAMRAFNGSGGIVYPINIEQLADLKLVQTSD